MTRWFRRLLGLLLALLLGLVLLAALMLQTRPLVAPQPPVAVADLERAHRMLRAQDPRLQGSSGPRRAVIVERDANLLLDRLADRWLPAQVELRLLPNRARLRASWALPDGWLRGCWVNVEAELSELAGRPVVDRLRVGRLPLPGIVADPLLRRLAAQLVAERADARLAGELVRALHFGRGRLLVDYEWRDDTAQRLAAALVPAPELERFQAYHRRLVELTQAAGGAREVPMVQLLQPLFVLAAQRSAAGGDAVQENRAALLTLALYVNGRALGALVPAARGWPGPRWLHVTLSGREDFPQHFLVSAGLTIEGGGPFADAMGIYKEVLDARGGSGFSFNDIAADRAGRRFGQRAQREPESLQAALARPLAERDLLPEVGDLPEFLPEAEFLRRYGGVGAPAYQQLLAEIDRRIAALPLLR